MNFSAKQLHFSFFWYCVKNILFTLSLCQCSRAFMPITFLLADLIPLINILEWPLIKSPVLNFSESNTAMALDYKYFILLNRIYIDIPVFFGNLFRANIRSALDFEREIDSCQNITLLLHGSNFGGLNIILFYFRFLLVVSV